MTSGLTPWEKEHLDKVEAVLSKWERAEHMLGRK
jgi:hypothetical protein